MAEIYLFPVKVVFRSGPLARPWLGAVPPGPAECGGHFVRIVEVQLGKFGPVGVRRHVGSWDCYGETCSFLDAMAIFPVSFSCRLPQQPAGINNANRVYSRVSLFFRNATQSTPPFNVEDWDVAFVPPNASRVFSSRITPDQSSTLKGAARLSCACIGFEFPRTPTDNPLSTTDSRFSCPQADPV